jgi:hypothetical protein
VAGGVFLSGLQEHGRQYRVAWFGHLAQVAAGQVPGCLEQHELAVGDGICGRLAGVLCRWGWAGSSLAEGADDEQLLAVPAGPRLR